MPRRTLADFSGRDVLTVPEAGEVLDLGRDAAYAAAERGEIPVLRFGRLLRVPTHALRQLVETGTWDGRKPELQVIRGGKAA